MPKGPFLIFDKLEPPASERRVTGIWRVASAKGNDFLGVVQWYAPGDGTRFARRRLRWYSTSPVSPRLPNS